MTVTDGMDTARARVIADQLKSQGSALAGLGVQGSVLMKTLEGVWSGPDVEEFAREWQTTRPAIARSSNHLTEAGHELSRQAAEQDETSIGGGAGGNGGTGAQRPHHGLVTGAPTLPPMVPGMRAQDPEKMWKTLQDVWEVHTHPIMELLRTAFDETLAKFLDDLAELGSKFRWLGTAGKVLGGIGGLISVGFGYRDIGRGLWRTLTEGPSVDSALQVLQGVLGTASGALAIAAAVLGISGVGLPLAAVLGVGSVALGLLSLAVGEAREYFPWFKQAIEEDPTWAAQISQEGGLRHGWELPERNAPIPKMYRKSDLPSFMGVPVGA